MNRQQSAKNKRYISPKILLIGDYEGLNDVVNKLNITKDIKQFDKTKKLGEYKDRDIVLVKLSRNVGETKECLGRLEKKYPKIPIVLIISPEQKEKDAVLMIQEFGLFASWRQNGDNINGLKGLVNKACEVSNTIKTERNFGHKLKELVVPPAISFLVVFVFWELVILVFSPEGYKLPSPHRVAVEIYRMSENLLWNTLWTALSAFCGLVLAFIVGVLSAILFFYYKKIDRAIMPYFIAIKATPIIALAPLIIRLFPGEFIQLVIMAALISFFPIVVSFVGGLRSVNREAEEFMTVLQASTTKKFFKLRNVSNFH